jgi:L-2-hydroxyglutarate oxidase LhgO
VTNNCYDYVIVGAGIVGLTVASELKRRTPSVRIAILDKETVLGAHASGRNSGVLHCGIYYGSDTLKAQVCSRGAARLIDFAKEHGIAFSQSGKVILATSDAQLGTVERLMQNAHANGIKAQRINQQEVHELEPAAAQGFGGVYCPDTGVIDSLAVLKKLRFLLEQQGVVFYFGCRVDGCNLSSQLKTNQGVFSFGFLFNCAGAHADTLARHFGLAQDYALVPFKGIYWKLSLEANHLVRANIYPVPDVRLPFLGVHLTRVISGDVYVGPTAIPVLGRENYHKSQGLRFKEAVNIGYRLGLMYLSNQNSFRLLAKTEIAKYTKSAFLSAARHLVPELKEADLVPTSKSGIRPQLINIKTKKLEMDYIFEHTDKSVHVLNSISPAFTSSFAFAEMIVNQSI